MDTAVFGSQIEPGVPMSKAHERYCRPDLLDEWRAVGSRIGWNTSHMLSKLGGLSPTQDRRHVDVMEFKAAQKKVVWDLVTKLRGGRLIATAFVVGPMGRNPDEKRRKIPEDVISARDFKPNWRKETISGNALEFVGVRMHAPQEEPEFSMSLIGSSLAECFRKLIIDDWVRQELEDTTFKRFPEWKVSPDSQHPLTGNRWYVEFEDWGDPAYSVQRHRFPIIVLGVQEPEPPEEVVEVWRRVEDRVRRLICWLRDGTLIAEGVVEPKDHALTRRIIPADWWSQPNVAFDHAENCLWNMADRVCMFSSIRIISPATGVEPGIPLQPPALDQAPTSEKSGSGERRVWDYLQQWKAREPGFPNGRRKTSIAKVLMELPEFAGYEFQTLVTYVSRALRDPKF